jgi:2-dehydro-3-deoxygluconokinase
MRLAREAGTQVAFDANLRLKLWPLDRARACIQQAVALCDVFLPSMEDVTALTGLSDADAVADWAHGLGAPTVIVKLGAQGVLVSAAGERRRIAAYKVPLLDATGAGDCFCGNLLAQLANDATLFDAACYANAAAALAVQGYGAVAPLPRPQQVQALLRASAQALP